MPPVTLPQAFELALAHHQAGRLAEAERIYRELLAVEPQHADALHLLGVIASQVGRPDLAEELIRQAIGLLPGAAAFHGNLGNALNELGRRDEAITAYRRAIELQPGSASAHHNLGNALRDEGRGEEAIAAFRQALQCDPSCAEAHNNLGNALRDAGCLEEAVAAFREALRLQPDFAYAHNNLGNALRDQGKLDEAIASFQQALQLQPAYAQAQNNLGNARRDRGDLGAAIAAYRRALQLDPAFAEAHHNLGVALHERGEFEAAVASCQQALRLRPDYAEAHHNLGNSLSKLDQGDAAIAAYRRALELRPAYAEAHNNLGATLLERGEIDEAIASFRRALAASRPALREQPHLAQAHSNLLVSLHYPDGLERAAIFAEHGRWDEIHGRPRAGERAVHGNDPDPDRRLKIGYVSPDFREHSVAFFLESLLACHARAQVEIFCYSEVQRPDGVTARLRRDAAHWRSIHGLPDAQAADLMRADGIDVLVDLAGHTANNRLPIVARRPAPVQVTYLGYCDTTGMKAMDYRLTDAHADPPGTTEHLHTEQLFRLPDCAWCFRPPADAPPVSALPMHSTGRVTFGCFNALPKLTEATLALWSQILHAVPGSRLLLKNHGFREPAVRWRIRRGLEKAGIAAERIELIGPARSVAEHLAAYGRVDLALDTFPYHGTTTTCEALWMGVPVVTLAGQTHASRVGVSLLTNAGIPELIASDRDEYLHLAVQLAADATRLADLRATLRARLASSPLMDAPRFAHNVEAAYREMWRQWCAGR